MIRTNTFIAWLVAVVACYYASSCKTKEQLTETTDSTSRLHIETVEGVDISSSDIRQWHWGERIYTIVLNEVGDTIREKELVYVEDKLSETYKDSLSMLHETLDSISNVKQRYIRYTVKEKQPWYTSWYVMLSTILTLVLLLVLALIWLTSKRNFFQSRSDGGADKE